MFALLPLCLVDGVLILHMASPQRQVLLNIQRRLWRFAPSSSKFNSVPILFFVVSRVHQIPMVWDHLLPWPRPVLLLVHAME